MKRLKIVVTEKEYQGRKFNTYHTYSKNGRRTDVKIRSEVDNKPTKTCYVEVLEENMNLNTSGEFPILWIKKIEKLEDLETANQEANKKKLDEYFG